MVHLVTEKCVKCKYTDCVAVCPVDCFHEGEEILVIDPDVCIDCGVCIPECPIEAIVNDETHVDGKKVEEIIELSDDTSLTKKQKNIKMMVNFNKTYSAKWDVITEIKEPLYNAEKFKDDENKIRYIEIIEKNE